ncbi:dipeptidase D [Pontibacter ummariensis]|uniref:Cytosol non-specific dipeptidase n=1 Tax=Pontibacter ummariensis TaxID=1610492 RepID=A0A239LX62_9BACT|nr:aminoacyl-histidine dipeptidase [Pontibacter ummariensis]PRY00368.1 dipeptidase D [Pontibacter ummariensis]SNT34393.1 dipeptidase D [Pontibacter ummariensis]
MSTLNSIKLLEPQALWQNFAALSAVPRPSKQEDKAAAFVVAFGRKQNLETMQDTAGNVLIRKPATPGMENRKTVLLQGHLDMVHQKNEATLFDFSRQGIEAYDDGDWVRAKGTTLGADNGIGVAAILAILASDTIAHPPLEALFTVDEEMGATGALNLGEGLLRADLLLNLDSEDDTLLTIGCAGSLDITVSGSYRQESIGATLQGYQLTVGGLTGGHSGLDIHLGRANAVKLLIHLLTQIKEVIELRICSMSGGNLRNAIPREATAAIAVPKEDVQLLNEVVSEQVEMLKASYAVTDPQLEVTLVPSPPHSSALPLEFQEKVLLAVHTCPNGIYSLSNTIPGLVQTSNNLSCVRVQDGSFHAFCLSRSFREEEKVRLAEVIKSAFAVTGVSVTSSGSVPGWQPDPDTSLVRLVQSLYLEEFGKAPVVSAIHAGLECGIIGAKYPNMEMISFGPNILGAHSPDERVQVSSVQKFWRLLLQVLLQVPLQNETNQRVENYNKTRSDNKKG